MFLRNSTTSGLSYSCKNDTWIIQEFCFSISPSSDPNFEKNKHHSHSGHLVSEFRRMQCRDIPQPSSRACTQMFLHFPGRIVLPRQPRTWVRLMLTPPSSVFYTPFCPCPWHLFREANNKLKEQLPTHSASSGPCGIQVFHKVNLKNPCAVLSGSYSIKVELLDGATEIVWSESRADT